jgi:hypothetical protein
MSSYAKNGTDPSFGAINTTISNKIVNGTLLGAGNITGGNFGAGNFNFTGNVNVTNNFTVDGGTLLVDGTNNKINITRTTIFSYPNNGFGYNIVNGSWYSTTMTSGGLGNEIVSTGTMNCFPFSYSYGWSWDSMGMVIGNTSVNTNHCTVALFNDTGTYGNPYPNYLLLNLTDQICNTSGAKNITGLSYAWKPNTLYWSCYWGNFTGNTMISTQNTGRQNILGYAMVGNGVITGYRITQAYNGTGFPSTFPAGATTTTSNSVGVFFRARSDITGTPI